MNHYEEVPDFLGGLGDMLPADVLKKVIELLEQLRLADKDHQGSKIELVYVAPGAQHVETVQNQYLYPAPSPSPHRGGESTVGGKPAPHRGGESMVEGKPAYDRSVESTMGGKPAYDRSVESTMGGKPAYDRSVESTVGGKPANDRGRELPEVLATVKAMELWRKAQVAGYVDANYQPLISRTQAALLADTMAERLGIKEKWKVFEGLWHRRNMYHDYYLALGQQQSLVFQDELKRLFST